MGRRSRTVVAGVAAGIIAAALASGGAHAQAGYDAAKREGKVTIYSGQPIDRLQKLADGFGRKYPGIVVDFYRGDTGQYGQKFEAESAAGRPIADVVLAATVTTRRWAARDLLQKYVSPAAADYPAELKDPDGYFNTFAINVTTFAWNTSKVKAEDAPRRWADLLDPKWKGRVGFQDPIAGGGARTWVITMYKVLGEEKWSDFMTRLAGQQPRYGAYMQVREMLTSGEVDVQVAAYPDFTEPLKAKGAPVEWGVPEFAVFVGNTTNLPKNPPNPNAARLFIDYLLADDGQKILGETDTIPAKPAWRPAAFARLNQARLIESLTADEAGKSDAYFSEKIKELFARR
jgi:iron(III) transport system substrate-binding protein